MFELVRAVGLEPPVSSFRKSAFTRVFNARHYVGTARLPYTLNDGPPSRTRTCGLRLRTPALSLPLSYGWKKCYRGRLDREATP